MASNPMSLVIQHLRRAALPPHGDCLTDGQLLAFFIERRDEAAFAALVRRHAAMVWGVCRRVLGDDHDAEDALQATFLVLVRKATSVVPREKVANWLHGVAQTTALRAKSLNARRRTKEKQVARMPEPTARTRDPWDDLRPLLDAELARLPEKYRLPIVLCDLEERSIKEAARHLGWPQGTLAGRLARARTMLAKRLTRRGLAFSGAALAMVLAEQAAPAGMPAAVVSSTVKATRLFAAGPAASGAISARAAALTEGVLKSMMLSKWKAATAAVVVTAASLAALGGGLATTYPAAAPQANDVKDDPVSRGEAKPPAEQKKRVPRYGDLAFPLFVDSGTVADKDKPTAAKTDLERLQGVWSVVSIENGGKPDKLQKAFFLVDGKRACWQTTNSELQGGLYLNPANRPKTYDLAMSTRTQEGIYVLDGETLRMCFENGTEAKRPSRFATKPGSQQVLIELTRLHGKEVFPFRLPDGTRAFPTLVERTNSDPVPPTPLPQPAPTSEPEVKTPAGTKTTDVNEKEPSTTESAMQTLSPPGLMPRQALVRLTKDTLVVRTLDVMVEPVAVIYQGRQATSYQKVELVKTRRFDMDMVKVYDVHGKRISKKQLPELLKKETVALVASDEQAAEPRNLRLFKEGTLLFILPGAIGGPTVYAYPTSDPPAPVAPPPMPLKPYTGPPPTAPFRTAPRWSAPPSEPPFPYAPTIPLSPAEPPAAGSPPPPVTGAPNK